MKRTFTFPLAAVVATILFISCQKERVYDDNSYWFSQERGTVVYSNNFCGYYVIETNYGYTIIQSLDGSVAFDNDVMYGDFGNYGSKNFYNYNANVVTRGNVVAYDLSYYEAQDEIAYYCSADKSNKSSIRQSSTSQKKVPRITNTIKN